MERRDAWAKASVHAIKWVGRTGVLFAGFLAIAAVAVIVKWLWFISNDQAKLESLVAGAGWTVLTSCVSFFAGRYLSKPDE